MATLCVTIVDTLQETSERCHTYASADHDGVFRTENMRRWTPKGATNSNAGQQLACLEASEETR